MIKPIAANREYTELGATFTSFDGVRYLKVQVHAGDLWPKEGSLIVTRIDVGAGGRRVAFRLTGNPVHPKVEFGNSAG